VPPQMPRLLSIHSIDISNYSAALVWAIDYYCYRRVSDLLRHLLGLAFSVCWYDRMCWPAVLELSSSRPARWLSPVAALIHHSRYSCFFPDCVRYFEGLG
jgi:hypothetical protein